jgi:hypothetical protein
MVDAARECGITAQAQRSTWSRRGTHDACMVLIADRRV